MKPYMYGLLSLAIVLVFGAIAFYMSRRKTSENFKGDDNDDDVDKGGKDEEAGETPVFTFWKMDKCPHCVRFMEDFEKLKKEWSGDDVRFDVNNNTSEASKKDIHSFPTLTLTMPDGTVETFSGTRKVDTITSWIKSKLDKAKSKTKK